MAHPQTYANVHHTQSVPPTFLDEGRGLLTLNPRSGELAWRDAETGAVLHSVRFPAEAASRRLMVHTVAASADGKHFAIGGYEGAQIWEVAPRRTVRDLVDQLVSPLMGRRSEGLAPGRAVNPFLAQRVTQHVVSAAFSPDGQTLVTGSSDRTVRRWAVPSGKALGQPLFHPTMVHLVGFSPDGRFLATAQRGGLVRLWALPTGDPRHYQVPLDGMHSNVKLSPDGRYILPTGMSYRDCTLRTPRVSEVATGQPAGPPLGTGEGIILDAGFSPDGRQVAMLRSLAESSQERGSFPGKQSGRVEVWEWRTGKPACDPLPMSSEPRSLDYSPVAQRLAVLCVSGELIVIDPTSGQIVRQWHVHSSPRLWNNFWVHNGAVKFSPDGQCILTWGTDPLVRVWDAASGKERYPGLVHEQQTFAVDFSPDGRLLATTAWDHTARVWDFATGRPVAQPLPHPEWPYTVQFSGDGQQLLTTCRDGMARLWDWRAGRLVCPAFVHDHEVFAAVFAPNGRWVLTASIDQTMRIWEWHTGKPVAPPFALSGMGLTLAVTPNGNHAVVGGMMNVLDVFHLGDLAVAAELDLDDLCVWSELVSGQRVERGGVTNLTPEQWLDRWRGFRSRHPDSRKIEPTGMTSPPPLPLIAR